MLTRDLLRKIRKIEIYTNRLVNEQMAGQYHSVFKGRGMSFDEVRQYMPGDDIRVIDWNVSARMNDIYVKQFVEERELTVMLIVDASASGIFGTQEQSKSELAAEICAVLAFSAIKNNDRVGLIIFTDQVEHYVPPKKGSKHVLRVISEVLNFKPKSTRTDINSGLEFLSRVTSRKAVTFLLSDFISPNYEKSLRIVHQKHDLVPVIITDPMELELPEIGMVFLRDPESGVVIPVNTSSKSVRRNYNRVILREKSVRESLFRRLKIDFINIDTDKEYIRPLINFFRIRARRW